MTVRYPCRDHTVAIALVAALLLCGWLTTATRAYGMPATDGPSFDCAKATRPIDRLICAQPELASADARLAKGYAAVRAARLGPAMRAGLLQAQRTWLTERDSECGSLLGGGDTTAATRCMTEAYATRVDQLDRQTPAPVTAQAVAIMEDAALAVAYPGKNLLTTGESPYGWARFAPGGKQLAVVIGDLRQVWWYDLASRRLQPVTPAWRNDNRDNADDIAGIDRTLWGSDGRLYAPARHWSGQSTVYVSDGSRTGAMERIPDKVLREDDQLDAESSLLASMLSDNRVIAAMGNREFVVLTRREGTDVIKLELLPREKRAITVASGSWELTGFLFDRATSQLFYPSDDGIMVLDAHTLLARRIAGTLIRDIPLDYDALSQQLAWKRKGACDDPGVVARPWASPAHICFAGIPTP